MLKSFLSFLCVLGLVSCADVTGHPHSAPQPQIRVNLVESTGLAVDHLLASMNPQISSDTTVLVASFANLDELTVSTKLGRLIAEEAAEHLIQRGFRVPEVRLANSLRFRDGGEFMLSRDLDDLKLRYQVDAGVVLTGTVSSLGGTTYVNFRLIRLSDGIALAASDLELSDRAAGR